MRPTMAYSFFRRSLYLVLHTKDNPSDEEWAEYIEYVRKNIQVQRPTMILTEAGGPNTMQRGQLNDLLEAANFKAKISVVTLSRLVRGIVTALSWFNPNIKAFSTIQIPAALEYLEIPKADHDAVQKEIIALRTKLGLPPTST